MIQSLARTAFAAIKTAQPSLVVVVAHSGQTANGFRGSVTADATAGAYGESGADTGSVYVDASELSVPAKGSTVTVGGEDVFVMATKLDPAGALFRLDYQKQRPVSGI